MNKDITIDQDALMLGIGKIELPINCVVVISEGKAKVRELPEHGEYRIVRLTENGKRMQEFGRMVIGIFERIKEETKIDYEDISLRIDKATELNKKAMEANVKEGWGMLMSYTPTEYITPMEYSASKKDEYFVKLIESDKVFELEYEDMKSFMARDGQKPLIKSY